VNKKEYFDIQKELQEKKVTLIAVSKTKPIHVLQEAYDIGIKIFGENRALELKEKYEALPKDIEWHMIGHLQSNKVKYIAPFVHLIHSIDKPGLLKEINKRAKQNDRIISVLLQLHIAKEESKYGFDEDELRDFLDSKKLSEYKNVKVVGLMGMATFTDNSGQVKAEFQSLKTIFDKIKTDFFLDDPDFSFLSMGMSGDYKLAIQAGSNMVRLGSIIFGVR